MSTKRNITIEVLNDLYYARFIATWRPEEEEGYVPPEPDNRPTQKKNVPYFLVLTTMFEGRNTEPGDNPLVTSQHPMPPTFLKSQIRHIAYMVANGLGIFQPPSLSHAATFLSKMKVGYTSVKEVKLTVSDVQSFTTLKVLKDKLDTYTDEQLTSVKVPVISENTIDAYNKGWDGTIHTEADSDIQQYFSITKLSNIYDVDNPYIHNSNLPEDIYDSYAPGTEDVYLSLMEQVADTKSATADNDADLEIQKVSDEISTGTTPTLEEVQQQVIKNLTAQLKDLGV